MEIKFEGYERRIDKINACLNENGIKDLEDAYNICSLVELCFYISETIDTADNVSSIFTKTVKNNFKWSFSYSVCSSELTKSMLA